MTIDETLSRAVRTVLKESAFFSSLDEAELIRLADRSRLARFAQGEVLLAQNETGDIAYVILEGEVDIYVDIDVARVYLAQRGTNQLVGELGALCSIPRTATVEARTPVIAAKLARDNLREAVISNQELCFQIMAELARRMDDMSQPLAYLSYAASALERNEYDPAILHALDSDPGKLGTFTKTFRNLADEIVAKRQQREELAVAAEIQRSMLPRQLPQDRLPPAYDLSAMMRPARDVGGDFYDYFALDDRRLGLVVADVSGKGIPAALFMAISRSIIRTVATERPDAAATLQHANQVLSEENDAMMFVTAIYAIIDLETGELEFCNAGHEPLYRLGADGALEQLFGGGGLPLGIEGSALYQSDRLTLKPGDALFFSTDGVREAFDRSREAYGNERLEAALRQAAGQPSRDMVEAVVGDVDHFTEGAEQSDDITCLAVSWTPGLP